MIYKGLMGREEVRDLLTKFPNIRWYQKYEGSYYNNGQFLKEDELLEIDMSAQTYNEIMSIDKPEVGDKNSTEILDLTSFGQGRMITDYKISGMGSTSNNVINYLKKQIDMVATPQGYYFINLFGKNLNEIQFNEKLQNLTMKVRPDRNSTYANNRNDMPYRIQDRNKNDKEMQFLRITGLANISLSVTNRYDGELDTHFLIFKPSSNAYGFEIEARSFYRTKMRLNNLQKRNLNIEPLNSEYSWLEKYQLKAISGVEYDINAGDFTKFLNPEAFNLFSRWLRKTKNKRMGNKQVFQIYTLNKNKIEKNPPLGIKVDNAFLNHVFTPTMTPTGTRYERSPSLESFLTRPLKVPPNKPEVLVNLVKEGFQEFFTNTRKYRPLGREFFTDKKFAEGRSNLFSTLRAKINIFMGSRTTHSGKQMRPVRNKDGNTTIGDTRKINKRLIELPQNIKDIVTLMNNKAIDLVPIKDLREVSKYWPNWVEEQFGDSTSDERGFVIGNFNSMQRVENFQRVGLLPEDDAEIGENAFAFTLAYEMGSFRSVYIFYVDLIKREITVVKAGVKDDTNVFTSQFQDYDLRVDLINAINRTLREPEGKAFGDSSRYRGNYRYMSGSPEQQATAFAAQLHKNPSWVNNSNVVYTSKITGDIASGKVGGSTIYYGPDQASYFIFPYSAFYHDRHGHGLDRANLCLTPITHPFGNQFYLYIKEIINNIPRNTKLDKIIPKEYRMNEELGDYTRKESLEQVIIYRWAEKLMGSKPLNESLGEMLKELALDCLEKYPPVSIGSPRCIHLGESKAPATDFAALFGSKISGDNPFPINPNVPAMGGVPRFDAPQAYNTDTLNFTVKEVAVIHSQYFNAMSVEEMTDLTNEVYREYFSKNKPNVPTLAQHG